MDLDASEQIPLKQRDNYVGVERIGRGAFGDVFLCQHRIHGDRVCVKEVDLQLLSPAERRGCLEEVAVLRRLPRHPHIISLVDAFRDQANPNLLLLVLEFADAGDLAQFLIDANGDSEGEEKRQHYLHQALQLFTQIVEGVAFLHARNVLHRDLKPRNVFLFHSSSTGSRAKYRAVVGDFGSSKTLVSSTALAQTVVGSPLYMSPELLESEPHGSPTDVWSLGCLLYEMLAGQPPFRAPSYPAVVRKITRGEYVPLTVEQAGNDGIQALVGLMLQRDPTKRPMANNLLKSPALTPYTSQQTASSESPASELMGTSEGSVDVAAASDDFVTEHLDFQSISKSQNIQADEANVVAVVPPPAPIGLPTAEHLTKSPLSVDTTETNDNDRVPSTSDGVVISTPLDGRNTAIERQIPAKTHHEALQQQKQQLQRAHPFASQSRASVHRGPDAHRISKRDTRPLFPVQEAVPHPPSPPSAQAPALRPSFHQKTAQHPSTKPTVDARAAIVTSKRTPTSSGNESNSTSRIRTATTATELLVIGVGVTPKRPTAMTKKSLHS